jgi:hypothetical protein
MAVKAASVFVMSLAFKENFETPSSPRKHIRPLIHIPWQIDWLGLKKLEWSGIRIVFRSDSIVDMV